VNRALRALGPQAAIGTVVEAWPDAVGETIARNAWPARFQRDGTLVVHARDAVWAFELQQRADEIRSRLPDTPALRFVPGPVPEPGAPTAVAEPEPGAPTATLEQAARAAAWAAAIEDDELRRVVARAARGSLSRRPVDRDF